jgi:phosphoadenosine phosphosulfate reductase
MLSKLVSGVLSKLEGEIALAFSYQAEDIVTLDLIRRYFTRPFEVFTLDTGKSFEATKAFHPIAETYFEISIKRYFPDHEEVIELEDDLGEWGMRNSLDDRQRCCRVRKVHPLRRALAGKTAWITGLRAEQSITRTGLPEIEYDETFQLIKFNPLINWHERQVFDYIETYQLPLHPLYQKGFKSIGCSPCTRAVQSGEDIRSGRWWWENPEHKECGLHVRESL